VFFLSLQHQLYMPLEPEFEMDDAFCEQLEEVVGCKLPIV
jgi:hypothetical protein